MKTVAARVSAPWYYETHTVDISLVNWRKIRLGKEVTVRGYSGYSEGEIVRERWTFSEGVSGKLVVWNDYGSGSFYEGNLTDGDVEIEEFIFPRIRIGSRYILDARPRTRDGRKFMQYLCISRKDRNRATLELCQYEILGEFSALGPDGKVREWPDLFDGKRVKAVEFGWLIGERLLDPEAGDSITVDSANLQSARNWLFTKGITLPEAAYTLIKNVASDRPKMPKRPKQSPAIGYDGHTICERDGTGGFPKRMSTNAIRAVFVEWSWSPMHSRCDQYRTDYSKDGKRALVWRKDTFCSDETNIYKGFEPYCSGPLGEDLVASALSAIERAWQYEKTTSQLDRPHLLDFILPEFEGEYSAMVKRIWGPTESQL